MRADGSERPLVRVFRETPDDRAVDDRRAADASPLEDRNHAPPHRDLRPLVAKETGERFGGGEPAIFGADARPLFEDEHVVPRFGQDERSGRSSRTAPDDDEVCNIARFAHARLAESEVTATSGIAKRARTIGCAPHPNSAIAFTR